MRKHWKGALFWSMVVVLAAGCIAPFLNAGAFRNRIRDSLERSLNRKVEISGPVVFDLFTGPGFSVSDVLISEDPEMGIEPFAHVETLDARVRLLSLLRGRLEFTNLRLGYPSVNVVKTAAGAWNLQRFLARRPAGLGSGGGMPPHIQVRHGRLNFKFADAKSVFYVSGADLDLWPAAHPGEPFHIVFTGEPSRTDRTDRGFGRFSGRGQWRVPRDSEPQINLELDLERSAIGEIMTLAQGYDIGLHGLVRSRARLSGPVSDVRIAGTLYVEDIHRWDLLPRGGRDWPLEYTGRWNLSGELLELETTKEARSAAPLAARLRAASYLTAPRWAVSLELNRLPLGSVLEIARHMGASVPAKAPVEGTLEGVVAYSPHGGVQGRVALRNASVDTPGVPLHVNEAQLIIDQGTLRLLPAEIVTGKGQRAQVELSYAFASRASDLRATTRGLAVSELLAAARRLPGAVPPPLLENFSNGTLRGSLRYRWDGEAEGNWTGNFELDDARAQIPGFAQPLRVRSAVVSLNDRRVVMNRMRAEIGSATIEGDYRYLPEATRPHRVNVTIPELELSELERILLPTLRRRQGFFARTLGLGGAAMPDWLKMRIAEGTVRIHKLPAGELTLTDVTIPMRWDRARVELADLTARLGDSPISASLFADLSGDAPEYRVTGTVEEYSWRGGTLDTEFTVQAIGTGSAFLESLRAEGVFHGRSLELIRDSEFRTFSAGYAVSFARGIPRLKLTDVQIALAGDTWSGQGDTSTDGRLSLELSSGGRHSRIAGTLVPLNLDMSAP